MADDLSELFASGFFPQPSTYMNIYDAHDTHPERIEDTLFDLELMIAPLISVHQRQYSYGDVHPETGEVVVDYAVYRGLSEGVTEFGARSFLLLTAIIERISPGSFGSVMKHNVLKVSERVLSGRVDKTDGDRNELRHTL